MTKKEMIQQIATECGVAQKDADAVIKAFLEKVKNAVNTDGEVQLLGFGTFKKKMRPAHDCRNPKDGGTIHVDAKNIVQFKAGKAFSDAVNA